ncbi:MAG: recombinase family protein [Bacteroidales bacterium]
MTQSHQIRFAPLIRVSTEDQEKRGESLRTQRTQIIEYVKNLGGTIPETCWKYSGQESATADKERKLLAQLLQDSSRDIYDAIICVDPSRWSRNNEKSKQGLEIMRNNGIRFFAGLMEYDLFDPTQMLFLGMSVEIGEYQASIQAVKSIQNRIERAKRGCPSSGKIPYGRVFDKKTETWTIDPVKHEIIKQAAKRYINGEQIKSIALSLNVPYYQLFRNLKDNCGGVFPQRFRYKNIDETVVSSIPALLDDQTIKQIHEQKEKNKTSQNYGKGNRKYDFLLSGYVFCARCGHRHAIYRNYRGFQYYRHIKGKNNNDCTFPHKVIPGYELENAVLLKIINTIGDRNRMQRAVERATPDLEKVEQLRSEQDTLLKKQKEINQQKQRLINSVAEGLLSKTDIQSKRTAIESDLNRITGLLNALQDTLDSIPQPEQIKRKSQWITKMTVTLSKNPALILGKSFKYKHELIQRVFTQKDMGVYVDFVDDQIIYTIKGLFDNITDTLPLTDEHIADAFKLDPEVHNIPEKVKEIRNELSNTQGKRECFYDQGDRSRRPRSFHGE